MDSWIFPPLHALGSLNTIILFDAKCVPNLVLVPFKHGPIKTRVNPLLSGPKYLRFALYFACCSRNGSSCFSKKPSFLPLWCPDRPGTENAPNSFL